jgi:hypothetical protein
MWIVSPATGIDFQPQTRLPCRPYYTAVPIGWQYVFPAKNNICVAFFRMSRRFRSKRKLFLFFSGIILNLPVLHRMLTNAVCFVLSFILKGCLFFHFCFIPHMPDFAKTASAGM